MELDRRRFLKWSGVFAGSALIPGAKAARAESAAVPGADDYGCLVDTTLCVGCRKCEQACNQRHGLPKPEESFEETSVLESPRRPDDTAYTVVNKYYPKKIGPLTALKKPTFVKFQCMHCVDPSCASACIVGALKKQPQGPITYDVSKCIGCRYCMVACPFQIPAYEYNVALTPRVRKCTFCFEYVKRGGLPACAQVCPREVMTFGKRGELLRLARWKIKNNPGKYVDHIYGEHEVGGTSWLYIASEPFTSIGFPKLGREAPPRLTESIQHALYHHLVGPIALYAVLAGTMWASGFYSKEKSYTVKKPGEKGDANDEKP